MDNSKDCLCICHVNEDFQQHTQKCCDKMEGTLDPPPAQIEEWEDILNNSHITGHISGRHLILIKGKKDRKWDGGGYEENEYEYLDDFIKRLLQKAVEEAVTERDRKFQNVLNNFSESGDPWKVVHELEAILNNHTE